MRWPKSTSLLLAASLFVGCGGMPGDDVEARGGASFRASSGRFAFDYVTPPWLVEKQEGDEVELRIPAEIFGVAVDAAPPTHALHVAVLSDDLTLEDYLDEASNTPWGDVDTPDLEGLGTTGGLEDLPGEVSEYLIDIDLSKPRDVAFGEINYLLDAQDGELIDDLQEFVTLKGERGVTFQVYIDPGVFVRAFYLPTSGNVLRATFLSLFDLDTADVNAMVDTLETDAGGRL